MTDEIMIESVARAVRSARRDRGLSLDQLAARAGVSKGALVALEGAAANPTLGTLVRLADALGVSVSALVGRVRAPAVRVADAAGIQSRERRHRLTAPAAPAALLRSRLRRLPGPHRAAAATCAAIPARPGIIPRGRAARSILGL